MRKHYLVGLVLIIIVFGAVPLELVSSRQPEENLLQEEMYFPLIQKLYFSSIPATRTPRPPGTPTQTRTPVPFRTATPRYTATQTLTPTLTPTNTPTPTYTPTTTLIPLVSITIEFPTLTPSSTPTRTPTRTALPSETPPPGGLPEIPPGSWVVIILLAVLWVILAAWLYIFLRQRRDGDLD